jgi:hypothetical protein
LVEAAGVEPASEKAYCKKTTCVSGSVILVHLMRKPARERQLSLIDLGLGLQTEAFTLSCKFTPLEQVQAHCPRTAT